jgi:hypothetical protein
VHGGEFLHPNSIVQNVYKAIEEYKLGHEASSDVRQLICIGPLIRWAAPPVGWWKVNWDFALDNTLHRMGFGVVVRDHEGKVLAARGVT